MLVTADMIVVPRADRRGNANADLAGWLCSCTVKRRAPGMPMRDANSGTVDGVRWAHRRSQVGAGPHPSALAVARCHRPAGGVDSVPAGRRSRLLRRWSRLGRYSQLGPQGMHGRLRRRGIIVALLKVPGPRSRRTAAWRTPVARDAPKSPMMRQVDPRGATNQRSVEPTGERGVQLGHRAPPVGGERSARASTSRSARFARNAV